jgi:glyoxylase I family protein
LTINGNILRIFGQTICQNTKFKTILRKAIRIQIFLKQRSIFMTNLGISSVHHIAIICSDYAISKKFYTEKLGLSIVREIYREARDSYKLDLALGEQYIIELFSFPNPPARPSRPEACGLRHLAFQVKNMEETIRQLASVNIDSEPIRIDEFTGKRFTFIADPDGLPIEFYEI